jgi:hypothetical protein
VELAIQPVERGANVILLSEAIIVLAVTKAGSAKIESKDWKPEAVQRFHGVEHNFVVQCAPEHGVRMADECRMGCVFSAHVENGFETPSGAVEEKRSDGASGGSHWE